MSSGVFSIWQRGGHGERAEREPIMEVWGQSPQRDPGAEPLVGGQGGEAPMKLKHFLLLNVQWKPQIRPFFPEICWKTAKNAPFHIKSPVKNFHGWAKGGPSHHAPPKYATADVLDPQLDNSLHCKTTM